MRTGAVFDDAIFHTWADEAGPGEFAMEGFDFPYRQLLPQRADGLIMAGRAAIVQPPVNRTRYKVMLMGQAAGLAAALAARAGIAPRHVNIGELQRSLIEKCRVPWRSSAQGDSGAVRKSWRTGESIEKTKATGKERK